MILVSHICISVFTIQAREKYSAAMYYRWWVVDMKRDPSPRSREFKWMGRDAQDPFIASPPPHNVDNVERCTGTMPPLSTLIVVCRFAGTDGQRAMIAKQPPPPPDESDFQLTKHFWGCFRPGLKIETNESRKQLTVSSGQSRSHSPLLLRCS